MGGSKWRVEREALVYGEGGLWGLGEIVRRSEVVDLIVDMIAAEACERDEKNMIRELESVLSEVGWVVGGLMRGCCM